jgi:hypothetical protein
MADPMPNPTPRPELRPDEDPADAQQLRCANRAACLDVAARQRWEAMACGQCRAFEPMPAAQWRDEVPQLAALGRALARVIRTGEPRLGARGRRTW